VAELLPDWPPACVADGPEPTSVGLATPGIGLAAEKLALAWSTCCGGTFSAKVTKQPKPRALIVLQNVLASSIPVNPPVRTPQRSF